MDGIHDLGGREGFGPIRWKPDEHAPSFHEEWQARAWAICMRMFAKWQRDDSGWTLDWFRHVLERIDPPDYLSMNYFDKWVQSCMAVLIDDGTFDLDDFVNGVSRAKSAGAVEPSSERAKSDQTSAINASNPLFVVGDAVTAKPIIGAMHTRLPGYIRGRSGLIDADHGMQILADASARGEMKREHLYTVGFAASELWPEATDRKDTIYVDLWESYLESTE
jgi:nitrile hydratase